MLAGYRQQSSFLAGVSFFMFFCSFKELNKFVGGSAIGVDLWSSWDQGGNSPQKPLTNAVLEGVGDLVTYDFHLQFNFVLIF